MPNATPTAEELQALVARVWENHQRAGDPALQGFCNMCDADWPCDDAQLANAVEFLVEELAGSPSRQDLVEAAWVIVDPLLTCATDVEEYDFGSSGPRLS